MSFPVDIQEQDGLRTLRFGTRVLQGAMWVDRPWDLALEYTRVMMACLLLRDARIFPRKVLLIGLGAGSLTKFLYRHCPEARLTVVEIEPAVVAAARAHFHLPEDPVRLRIESGDGCGYLRNSDERYDLILVDGFNPHAHAGELNTPWFYAVCRERLDSQGLLVVNLIGLSARYQGSFPHLKAAFEGRALLFPRCQSGNTIAFAATGELIELSLDELMERALLLEARTGLALLPAVMGLDGEAACPAGRLRL